MAETVESQTMALQENERRYRLVFEGNPLPMWIWEVSTRRFLAVNDAAVAHYGYDRELFLTMTIEDIRPREELPALEDARPPSTWRMISRFRRSPGGCSSDKATA